jgi:RNA polymerase-binding transcription factor DksA
MTTSDSSIKESAGTADGIDWVDDRPADEVGDTTNKTLCPLCGQEIGLDGKSARKHIPRCRRAQERQEGDAQLELTDLGEVFSGL